MPLHESAQMIVHVGPLECLPKEEDQSYSLRKHVMDLESKIDENNDTIVKNDEECKEKVQELASKDVQHDQEFLNMKSDLESKINENNDTIVKKDEECKEKVQELAAKDIQHDNKLQALTTKDSEQDNKLQGLTTKDSQDDQEILDLNSVAKCPFGGVNVFNIDGGCYMFVDQEKKFNGAKSYCKSKSGRLFEPRTIHTNKLVYDKGLEVLNNNDMWFGIISKNGKSGPWKFATSGENIGQAMWDSSQPNESRSELCGYYSSSYAKKWCDTSCNRGSRRFICEFV